MAEPVYGQGREDDEEERNPESEGRGRRQVRVSDVKRVLSSVQVPVSTVKRGLSSVQVPFGDVTRGLSSVQVPDGDVKRSLSSVQVPVSDEGCVARLLLLHIVLLPLPPLRLCAPHLLLLHSIWNWFPRFWQFKVEGATFRWSVYIQFGYAFIRRFLWGIRVKINKGHI